MASRSQFKDENLLGQKFNKNVQYKPSKKSLLRIPLKSLHFVNSYLIFRKLSNLPAEQRQTSDIGASKSRSLLKNEKFSGHKTVRISNPNSLGTA